MSDAKKTNKQLIDELTQARALIAELEASEAKRLAIVSRIAGAASATLHLDDLMETVYREIVPTFQPDAFLIALYDKEANELDFRVVMEEGVWGSPERHPLGGFSSIVVTEKKPLSIRDFEQERDHLPTPVMVGEETKFYPSWLGVPMLMGEQVMGIITVMSDHAYAYDEEDELLLLTIADQVAVAVQNARLSEETQRRVRKMQLLHEVSLAVASGVRLEETLQAIAESLAAEFGEVYIGIALLDLENNTLHRKASAGPLPAGEFPAQGIPVGDGVIGWVVQHGESALIPDVRLDSRYVGVVSDTRAELCTPLMMESLVIGIINIESSQPNAFTDDDQRLLSTLASNMAVLVERAQLFDDMEQMVTQRTRELRESLEKSARLQRQVIEAQKRAIQELSTPIIPIMDHIIVMPLIGSIDTLRARDITRSLLAGIREHRAKAVILDITGVAIVDSGVASHLNKTIQAARLKGARTIVTGISDAVAETIVDLGIDWSGIKTLSDLQTGLRVALAKMGRRIEG